ncbi:uncharacterized protein TNCV_1157411 [Trichonephila clavipes]|nr:uncharacterized protein TNCV_1157411 [Trichonephila clavipes]
MGCGPITFPKTGISFYCGTIPGAVVQFHFFGEKEDSHQAKSIMEEALKSRSIGKYAVDRNYISFEWEPENSLAVLNHKILEANSQVQNVKLGGYQTCLSINRLWHELCDMLRRLFGTTTPGHHDCSIQE